MKKKIFLIITIVLINSPMNALAEEDEVDIHGFISQGYLWSDRYNFYNAETEDGTFQFNDLGVNFTTQLSDNLRAGMQLYARDLGDVGNDEINVDWAYGDYRFSNLIGVRVGRIKRSYGLFNQIRDVDLGRTVIFLPEGMYFETLRDQFLSVKGAGIYGTLPCRVEYQILYGETPASNSSGAASFLETIGVHLIDVSTEPTYTFHMLWRPMNSLSAGGSTFNFKSTVETSLGAIEFNGENYQVFLQYFYDNLMVATEYQWGDAALLFPATPALKRVAKPVGYSGMVTYRFADWFEGGLTYSEYYIDKNDKDGKKALANAEVKDKKERWLKDLSFSTRFDINDFWILKLEAHRTDGLFSVVDYGGRKKPGAISHLVAVKMSYVF
ncbi:MAG: hypothetical protein KJ737_27400 [Proteobacteria bacterium]|nr:hypothetical protein [Pseudomonadota bacterium]